MDSANRCRLRKFRSDGKDTHSAMDGGISGISVSDRARPSFYETVAAHMWSDGHATEDLASGCYISEIFADIHQLVLDFDFTFTSELPDEFRDGGALEEIISAACVGISAAYPTLGDIIVTSCAPTALAVPGTYKAGIHAYLPSLYTDAATYETIIRSVQKALGETLHLELQCGLGRILADKSSSIIDAGVSSLRLYCSKKYARRCRPSELGHTACTRRCMLGVADKKKRYRRYGFTAAYSFVDGQLERTEAYADTFELAEQQGTDVRTVDARVDVLTLLSTRPPQRSLAVTPLRPEFVSRQPVVDASPTHAAPSTDAKSDAGIDLAEDDHRFVIIQQQFHAMLGKRQGGVASVRLSKTHATIKLSRNICFAHRLCDDGSIHEHSSNGSFALFYPNGCISIRSHDDDEKCANHQQLVQVRNRKVISVVFGRPPAESRAFAVYSEKCTSVRSTLEDGALRVRAYCARRCNRAHKARDILSRKFFFVE